MYSCTQQTWTRRSSCHCVSPFLLKRVKGFRVWLRFLHERSVKPTRRIVWTLTESTLCVSVLKRTFRSRHLMILKHALCSDTQSSPCPLQWNYCLYQNVITVIVRLLCTVTQQEEMSASQFSGCLQMAACRLEPASLNWSSETDKWNYFTGWSCWSLALWGLHFHVLS